MVEGDFEMINDWLPFVIALEFLFDGYLFLIIVLKARGII
jgi:hypothetical protein